jgi:hypothetical protein
MVSFRGAASTKVRRYEYLYESRKGYKTLGKVLIACQLSVGSDEPLQTMIQ